MRSPPAKPSPDGPRNAPRAACFATGADPGSWTIDELCLRVVEALFLVRAMDQGGVEPVIMEDFVRVVEDVAFENGALAEARDALLDTLDARGLALLPAERARIRAEESIDRLRIWRRRAVTLRSATEVFAEDPAPRPARRRAPRR